jgi:hypothetical protein
MFVRRFQDMFGHASEPDSEGGVLMRALHTPQHKEGCPFYQPEMGSHLVRDVGF